MAWLGVAGQIDLPQNDVGQGINGLLVADIPALQSGRLHRGTIVLPKLSDDDVERISALDRGEEGRTGPHPDRFAIVS